MSQQPEEPATWLSPETVRAVAGSAMSGREEPAVVEALCGAARAFVEGKRGDLFQLEDPAVPDGPRRFAATPDVVVGAAFLVLRWYSRRSAPLGVVAASDGVGGDQLSGILREDPDIARLLGIGRHGPFVFGGTGPVGYGFDTRGL